VKKYYGCFGGGRGVEVVPGTGIGSAGDAGCWGSDNRILATYNISREY